MSVGLCDFGHSLPQSDEDRASSKGTRRYMPPERLATEYCGAASDIWSLGLSLSTVTNSGLYPLEQATDVFEMQDIADDAVETICGSGVCRKGMRSNLAAGFHPSDVLREFLSEMLNAQKTAAASPTYCCILSWSVAWVGRLRAPKL
jgi:serine/threonine protein kinase